MHLMVLSAVPFLCWVYGGAGWYMMAFISNVPWNSLFANSPVEDVITKLARVLEG